MADPRWWIKLSKITVKSVQYVHPLVFGVADYEFIVRFTKFNIADSRRWMTFSKIYFMNSRSEYDPVETYSCNRFLTVFLSKDGTLILSPIEHNRLSPPPPLCLSLSLMSLMESSRVSPDITISGIPAAITDSPRTMVLRLFEALQIPELAVDVLSIRSLTKRDVSAVGDHRSTVGSSSMSFVVTLKSSRIDDHVISKKREKRNLTVKLVLALDQPGSIFVRELLPSAVYGLLCRTKAVAAKQRYKYVWVKSGEFLR